MRETKSMEELFDIENRIKPLIPLWLLVLFTGTIFSLGIFGFISFVIEALNWK